MTMIRTLAILTPVLMATAAAGATGPGPVAGMKWQNRVVLVSAADPRDPKIALQRRILSEWKQGAADRDIAFVSVAGSSVQGASDSPAALRNTYKLASNGFQALLIGKDGHVAMRSPQPIDANTLEGTIDAMPMRRNGER